MTSRERFEAWYASPAYPMARPIGWHTNGFRQSHGEYWVGEIQEEWLTWQAAEQETARRCAEICCNAALAKESAYECQHDIIAEFPEAFK